MTNFCGNLAPHDSHELDAPTPAQLAMYYEMPRPADRICPGEPLVEGSQECALHQRPLAFCQCREERRRAHAS